MRVTHHASLASVVGVVTLIGFCVPAGAQSVRIDGGVVSRNTFGFYWETRLEPPTPGLGDAFSTTTGDGPGAIHRLMIDRSRRVYFGYDVVVEPLPEASSYRVSFQQLVTTPELRGDSWRTGHWMDATADAWRFRRRNRLGAAMCWR